MKKIAVIKAIPPGLNSRKLPEGEAKKLIITNDAKNRISKALEASRIANTKQRVFQ
nr:hypothetical protein [Candidatus Gracilibacteria bacterium]